MLVVEDGLGRSDAESYISVADADARQSGLGNAAWAGDETAKEQALRRATAYIEQRYRQRWRGTKLLRDQALSWPRYGAVVDGWDVASNVVPVEVANACADLAVKALTETLNEDQTRGIVRDKVGPIETEYDAYAPQAKRFVAIDQMLAPYLTGGGSFRRVMRA